MDMKIIYTLCVTVGIILIVLGAYFAGYDYNKSEESESAKEPEAITPSTWITHYNKYESDLAPLEQQWDSLGKEWWGYYNEQNFDMAKETNAKMKLLSEQMHILLEKYKATRHE